MKKSFLAMVIAASLPTLAFSQFSNQDQQPPGPATSDPSAGAASGSATTAAPPASARPRVGPPPVNVLSGRQAALGAKEAQGVRLADEWKGKAKGHLPKRGKDGTVVFAYGATLPTIVCAPLYVCNMHLQPGEVVNQVDVADPVRWKVTPSVYGSGSSATTLLVIKPTDAGLETSMTVATDRRVYVAKLASRLKDWMPNVSFSYPEDATTAWSAYHAQYQRQATILPDGQNTANLDFGYRLKGDTPDWKPLRVYTDGVKTYVQFPPEAKNNELPALVAIGSDRKEQLVNYRLVGDRFVVDKVLKRAALISGVGRSQEKVEILREERVN